MTGESVVPGVMPDEIVSSEAPDSTGILDDAMVMTAPASSVPDEATTTVSAPVAEGKPYQLRMLNLHTGESLDIVYRIGNVYIPEALDKLNYFLRDHYTQDVSQYDPKEFDVLHAMMSRLGRLNNGVIDIVCGYRTPETNAALRRNAPWTGVAEHSQHMEGHAIDIRVPGGVDGGASECGAVAACGRRGLLSGVAVRACGRGAGAGMGVWTLAVATTESPDASQRGDVKFAFTLRNG